MKQSKMKVYTLVSLGALALGGLSACGGGVGPSSAKEALANVILADNGHGDLSIEGYQDGGEVKLNTNITGKSLPDERYYLDSLFVDGTDILTSLSFTVSEAVSYVVNATFLPSIEKGDYLVKLSGQRIVEVGASFTLVPTVYGPNKKVSYFVNDPDLAKVDDDGLVTAKKAGFVTVTATAVGSDIYNPVSASCSFFIAPTYFSRMLDSFAEVSLSDGVSFQGNIDFCYSPSVGEDSEKDKMNIPYTFTLKKDEQKGYEADFNIEINSSAVFLTFALGP